MHMFAYYSEYKCIYVHINLLRMHIIAKYAKICKNIPNIQYMQNFAIYAIYAKIHQICRNISNVQNMQKNAK